MHENEAFSPIYFNNRFIYRCDTGILKEITSMTHTRTRARVRAGICVYSESFNIVTLNNLFLPYYMCQKLRIRYLYITNRIKP